MPSTRCLCIALCASVMLSGCGPSKPPAYPVKGKVSGGTGSLAGVIISFSATDENGTHSSGVINEDGTYELKTTDGRPGAVPGKYKVVLALGAASMESAMGGMSKDPPKSGSGGPGGMPRMRPGMPMPVGGMGGGAKSGPPKFERPFPEAYSSAKTSPKELEVKSGSNEIDISL